MKRILIFSLAYYPKNVGGAEVAIKEITDRINSTDVAFHMVTHRFYPDQPATEQIGNVLVYRVGRPWEARLTRRIAPLLALSKSLFLVRAAFTAMRLHRTYRYDGMWAMMSYMTVPIVLARCVGVRTPYAITLQEGDTHAHVYERARVRPLMPLIRAAFRRATRVTAISAFLAHWATELGAVQQPLVIHNGVDFTRFSTPASVEERTRTITMLGKKEGETWLIHTGRLVPKNGIDTIVRALPHLPETVHLFQLGDGPDGAAIRALADSLGVGARYHTHPYVHIDAIPGYLSACDIFIRPSRSEGMGNSFVEAMAAGVPVIGTREGGIADFLFGADDSKHEQTGFVVRADNHMDIAARVIGILEATPEQRAVITERARAMVARDFNWDGIALDMHTKVFAHLAA